MKRPSYWAAVRWIADNDNPGDDEPSENIAGYMTVLLVADLFGVEADNVAIDVWAQRQHLET